MNFLLMLFVVNITSVKSKMIKVVTTHERTPPPASSASRVEVLGAGLESHPDLTMCVRFITYQFGSLLYNYQGILFVNPLREGFKVERAKVFMKSWTN